MLLFEFEADVNAQTADGNTALHTAVGRNMSAMVALLVAAGAKPSIRNGEGDLPGDLTRAEAVSNPTRKAAFAVVFSPLAWWGDVALRD